MDVFSSVTYFYHLLHLINISYFFLPWVLQLIFVLSTISLLCKVISLNVSFPFGLTHVYYSLLHAYGTFRLPWRKYIDSYKIVYSLSLVILLNKNLRSTSMMSGTGVFRARALALGTQQQ